MPYCVKVIVSVGGLGEAKLSCRVNTSISLIDCAPLKVISTESGKAFAVPSFQPPPLPQPTPARSPLLTLLTGKSELKVEEATATPPFAANATFTPGGGVGVGVGVGVPSGLGAWI